MVDEVEDGASVAEGTTGDARTDIGVVEEVTLARLREEALRRGEVGKADGRRGGRDPVGRMRRAGTAGVVVDPRSSGTSTTRGLIVHARFSATPYMEGALHTIFPTADFAMPRTELGECCCRRWLVVVVVDREREGGQGGCFQTRVEPQYPCMTNEVSIRRSSQILWPLLVTPQRLTFFFYLVGRGRELAAGPRSS